MHCDGGPDLFDAWRPFALEVVEALLLAGLPVFDSEAAADGVESGVELFVQEEPGQPVLRLVWRQHPAVQRSGEPWHGVQSTMHHALREVLAAHGHSVRADVPHNAPTVLPAERTL
ncbi:hypothetical protein [Kitasatospora aureofaciens]|uniref:hypothetical protein n=1 Tax=Kitasatospora aureofaciens TaxID=1894 RepID=UPI00380180C0